MNFQNKKNNHIFMTVLLIVFMARAVRVVDISRIVVIHIRADSCKFDIPMPVIFEFKGVDGNPVCRVDFCLRIRHTGIHRNKRDKYDKQFFSCYPFFFELKISFISLTSLHILHTLKNQIIWRIIIARLIMKPKHITNA